MSRYIPFGIVFLGVLVGILFNRSGAQSLREDMSKRFDQVDKRFAQTDARFDRIESKLDRIQSDMISFAHEHGRHDGRIDALELNRK
jgi:chaperonin cofactor prefoldin